MNDFLRTVPLDDIRIRSGGDGRTVEAYAAVFDQTVPINDADGQYQERIDPAAFNKTLADKGTRFGVLFNHGMTIYGTPSDRGSMPIGTPLEVRADTRGLLTVTRYNNTPLADEALDAIKSGSITAQSFQGRFVRSDKPTPRGGFRMGKDGALTTVTRTEINLKEYGPAVFAAYSGAAIVGVRSLAEQIHGLTPEQLEELLPLLARATRDGEPDLGTDTPDGAVTDEPHMHSGRLSLSLRTRQILAANHQEKSA